NGAIVQALHLQVRLAAAASLPSKAQATEDVFHGCLFLCDLKRVGAQGGGVRLVDAPRETRDDAPAQRRRRAGRRSPRARSSSAGSGQARGGRASRARSISGEVGLAEGSASGTGMVRAARDTVRAALVDAEGAASVGIGPESVLPETCDCAAAVT